jgi:hypothetical protein
MKKVFNNDGQQYQQTEQSPLTSLPLNTKHHAIWPWESMSLAGDRHNTVASLMIFNSIEYY